jgi:hypothetical protein
MFIQLLPHFHELGCVSRLDNGSITMGNTACAQVERPARQWTLARWSAVDSANGGSLGRPPFSKSEWTKRRGTTDVGRNTTRWMERAATSSKYT